MHYTRVLYARAMPIQSSNFNILFAKGNDQINQATPDNGKSFIV